VASVPDDGVAGAANETDSGEMLEIVGATPGVANAKVTPAGQGAGLHVAVSGETVEPAAAGTGKVVPFVRLTLVKTFEAAPDGPVDLIIS
jgi:hypothetical protein